MEICRENPNLVGIGQKFRALHEDVSAFHTVGSDVCRVTINTMHCDASVATLSVFIPLLTVTCTSTIHTECIVAFSLQHWLRESPTLLIVLFSMHQS
jgi:hypothetical protein